MIREEKQKVIDALKLSAPVIAMTQEEFNDYIQTLNKVMDWLEQEPTTRNCFGCKYSKDNHMAGTEECHLCMWENQYTPTTKNDLGVDCIDRAELLKAMDTWDKFGYTARYGLERLDKDDRGFVPYVHYEDMVKCVKGMPSVTPQEPKEITLEDVKGYCKPRLLTIITNELYYELTHFKIKAREQEPIIDKIRAEIEQIELLARYTRGDIKQMALDIIDKYKAESEG